MKFGKKYLAITISVIFLIIPIFFGIYIDFLIVNEISLGVVLFLFIGFVILLGLEKAMEHFMYKERSKELMKQHDVVAALLKGNDKALEVYSWIMGLKHAADVREKDEFEKLRAKRREVSRKLLSVDRRKKELDEVLNNK